MTELTSHIFIFLDYPSFRDSVIANNVYFISSLPMRGHIPVYFTEYKNMGNSEASQTVRDQSINFTLLLLLNDLCKSMKRENASYTSFRQHSTTMTCL